MPTLFTIDTLSEALAAIHFMRPGFPAYPVGTLPGLTAEEQTHVCACYYLGPPQQTLKAVISVKPALLGEPLSRCLPATLGGEAQTRAALAARRVIWRTSE